MAGAPEFRSASELRADFAARRISPVEVMERVLGRIAGLDGKLRCFHAVNEAALQAARDADKATTKPWVRCTVFHSQ